MRTPAWTGTLLLQSPSTNALLSLSYVGHVAVVAVKMSEKGRSSSITRAAKTGAVSRLGTSPFAPPPCRMVSFHHLIIRRVRWVQEIFVCTKFPAEYSDTPVQKGGSEYISPWEFETVGTDPINVQDTSSVICANCHTTMNHIAPLFANFDMNGMWTDQIQVLTPTTPDPVTTELGHWLRPGETTSWRLGEQAPDLPALGKAMAADPDVAECAVARMWNFAMSKEDIVSDLATVPTTVLEPYIEEFGANGMNLKQVLRSIFASEDFVRF